MRNESTKQKLWNSLYDLLVEEKTIFSNISVRSIAKNAGVHHSTFYEYFSDKLDLLDYGLTLLMEEYNMIPIQERFMRPFQEINRSFRGNPESLLIEI